MTVFVRNQTGIQSKQRQKTAAILAKKLATIHPTENMKRLNTDDRFVVKVPAGRALVQTQTELARHNDGIVEH